MLFKLETEDDYGIWRDVRDAQGSILLFDTEEAARNRLRELFPVLVQMERYGGGKRTRVVRVYASDAEWQDGAPRRQP